MLVEVLKSKLHRARITGSHLEYEGSLGIDRDLMDAVGLLAWERILVVNKTNGERLVTYVITEPRGSGTICLNGAAARRGQVGDEVTIMSFANVPAENAAAHRPRIAVLDAQNRIAEVKGAD